VSVAFLQDLEDSDASDDEEADPDEIDTPNNKRFRCTQGSHFKRFLMAVLGEERESDIGEAGEDMGEEDEAPCTLLQLTSALLEIEIKHAVSKELMQDILSVVRMGRSNHDKMIIPPSIHLLRKTMDVPDLQTVEYHKCPCGYIYKNTVLPNERNKDEECGAGCGRKRFKADSCGSPKPWQLFYYYGVENCIRSLFSSQKFRDSRNKSVESDRAGNSVYKSEWFRWLTEKEPNAGDKVTSIWSIGIDGSQPFGRRAHSCTLIVLKCEDMDSEGRYLSCNSRLLGIIPGPKEPKDLNPFLCFIGEEFERLRSSTMPYEYQECDESGEAIKYSGTHRPVLGFIYADAKAREKVHLCFPGIATKGCYFCWQHASQVVEQEEGKSRKRRLFTGYVENDAATHVNGIQNHVFKASRDNRSAIEKSVIGHADMEKILDIMRNATLHGTHDGTTLKEWQDRLGMYDYAKVFHVVPTLHVKHGIPAPLYHLILLGLAKNFIRYLWDGHSKKKTSVPSVRSMRVNNKETVRRLEKGIILSNSFNRPYSPIEYCNGWICEEVKVFIEVHSCALFNEEVTGVQVLTPKAMEAWGHLRKFTMHHISHGEGYKLEPCIALEHLEEFSRICQEEKAYELLTPNLHTANCLLHHMENFLGPLDQMSELWVERAMRLVSSTNCINVPESTLAKRYLIKAALEKAKRELGPADQSAIPTYAPNGQRLVSGMMYDLQPHATYHLRGKGSEQNVTGCIQARDSAKDKLKASVEGEKVNLIREFHAKHKNERPREPQKDIILYSHSSCNILVDGKGFNIKSFYDKRDKKRRSHFVLVRDKDSEAHHIGLVYDFIRIFSPRAPDEVERHAVCGIYKTSRMNYHGSTVYTVGEFKGESPWKDDKHVTTVPITDLVCQVSCFEMIKDGWKGEWPHHKLVDGGNRKEMDKMLAFFPTKGSTFAATESIDIE